MTEPNHQRVPLLQKMEIADILDTAIRLYRQNLTLFMEIVAVVQVFLMAIYMIGMWVGAQTIMATPSEEIPWLALLGLGPIGLLYIGGWILLFPVSEAALAFAVSETYLGRRISVLEAYRRMWPLLWRLLGTMILVSIVISLGTGMCLIPGLLVWVWFAITTPIVALERTAGPTAMDRSYRLVSGHWWRVFGTLLLLQLIIIVATVAISVPPMLAAMLLLGESNPLLAQSLTTAVQTITNIVVRPVLMIATVLIYYDLRIRKEGFDLVTLTQALERSRGGAVDERKPAVEEPARQDLPPPAPRRTPLPPRPNQSKSEQQPLT